MLKSLKNPSLRKNASSISHWSTTNPYSAADKKAISFSAINLSDSKSDEPKSKFAPCSSESLWLNLIKSTTSSLVKIVSPTLNAVFS